MNRVLREAKRIIRRAQADGYDGDFAIITEPVMEDIQVTCGRAIAENVMYQVVISRLICGTRICDLCEDCEECQSNKQKAWQEGHCSDFMLRFPDDKEAKEAFNECYNECNKDCNKDCNKEAHDAQTV